MREKEKEKEKKEREGVVIKYRFFFSSSRHFFVDIYYFCQGKGCGAGFALTFGKKSEKTCFGTKKTHLK